MTELLPLLWLDFETPGVPYQQYPLEVGVVITDANFKYNRTSHTFHALCRLPPNFNKAYIPQVVRDMHEKNGLWNDLNTAPNAHPFGPNYVYVPGSLYKNASYLDYALATWICDKLDTSYSAFLSYTPVTPLVRLAGKGVSHFDSNILRRYLPLTWSLIEGYDVETKPTVDISVIRRFFEHANIDLWPLVKKGLGALPETLTPHRALDDVELCIAEAQSLRSLLDEISEKAKYWDAYLMGLRDR